MLVHFTPILKPQVSPKRVITVSIFEKSQTFSCIVVNKDVPGFDNVLCRSLTKIMQAAGGTVDQLA